MSKCSGLFLNEIDLCEQTAEFGADMLELFAVDGRKLRQRLFTTTGELNKHLPPVRNGRRTRHQFIHDQPVNQPDRAMVAKLQSFCQFAHRDPVPSGETLNGEQCLMLLGRDSGSLRRRFTEMDEFPQRITKCGECFILSLLKFIGSRHHDKFNTSPGVVAIICLTISQYDICCASDK